VVRKIRKSSKTSKRETGKKGRAGKGQAFLTPNRKVVHVRGKHLLLANPNETKMPVLFQKNACPFTTFTKNRGEGNVQVMVEMGR